MVTYKIEYIYKYGVMWVYEHYQTIYTGWWLTYPSEKMMEFVSWDDDIPNILWKVIKVMFQTTNQTSSIYHQQTR